MNLRRQLLIVALMLLSLPWAGCQFVREMEGALRAGQAQSLQATAHAIAAVLSRQPQLIYPYDERRSDEQDQRRSLYAVATASPVIVDGYDDGWGEVLSQQFTSKQGTGTIQTKAQTQGDTLYLLFKVSDEEIIYHNPGLSAEANGDRLVLSLWHNGNRQDYVIATAAPGPVRASVTRRAQGALDAGRIRGVWQDSLGGYTLELSLPLSYTGGRLGFYVVNESQLRGRSTRFLGSISGPGSAPPPWLIFSPHGLQTLLTSLVRPDTQVRVLDRQQWQVAQVNGVKAQAQDDANTFWLLRLLYRSILAGHDLALPSPLQDDGRLQGPEADTALTGHGAQARYRDPVNNGRTLLSSAAPIEGDNGILGAVIVRESSETYLSLTDRAFSRLLGYSALAVSLGIGALLIYASVLSWRIRRLSMSAARAIGEDGRVSGQFPRSRANDEIGALSRQYADLLQRVQRYNDYLHSLSRKLSHELRTPIAVIQGSLDNLEEADARHTATYLKRAREGLTRLQRILTAMSEASALEDSIRSQPIQHTTLNNLLQDIFPVYQDLYPQQHLTLLRPSSNAIIMAAPELLVQALDKLMDNAASFAPENGRIQIHLQQNDQYWQLIVSNQGPPLPDTIGGTLFTAMVSHRAQGGEDVHLGLGLHIVRLIMDYHEGTVEAENNPECSGVNFTLTFKAAPQTED